MSREPWVDGDSASCPRLLRFLALHAVIGAVCGAVAAALLIGLNAAGLRDLLAAGNAMGIGSAMLTIGFALTFASASMGTAIMLLPRARSADAADRRNPPRTMG